MDIHYSTAALSNGVRERLRIVVSVTRQWTVATEWLSTAHWNVRYKSHKTSPLCSRKILLSVLLNTEWRFKLLNRSMKWLFLRLCEREKPHTPKDLDVKRRWSKHKTVESDNEAHEKAHQLVRHSELITLASGKANVNNLNVCRLFSAAE